MNQSLADKAYQLIKRDILACVLEPGQVVIQARLARDYGIGVTPVREALYRLAEAGLIEPVAGGGFAVSSVTLEGVQQLFELRTILEVAAVRLAALRGTDDDFEALCENAAFSYTFVDKASYVAYLAANSDFHRSIALVAGNARLAEAVSGVLDELTRVFHMVLGHQDRSEEKVHAHVHLAQALCERDVETAVYLVEKEIKDTETMVWQAAGARPACSIVLTR